MGFRLTSGSAADLSGPALVEKTKGLFPEAEVATKVVPDEIEEISTVVKECAAQNFDLVLTTGISPLITRWHWICSS